MNGFHVLQPGIRVLLTVLVESTASLHDPLIKDDAEREIDCGGVIQASVTAYNPDIGVTDRISCNTGTIVPIFYTVFLILLPAFSELTVRCCEHAVVKNVAVYANV